MESAIGQWCPDRTTPLGGCKIGEPAVLSIAAWGLGITVQNYCNELNSVQEQELKHSVKKLERVNQERAKSSFAGAVFLSRLVRVRLNPWVIPRQTLVQVLAINGKLFGSFFQPSRRFGDQFGFSFERQFAR